MKLTSLITAASAVLLPIAASAATFIIPAAGTGPGDHGSQWQSEVTIHNGGAAPIAAGLAFHSGDQVQSSDTLTVAARSTVALSDVVAARFGLQQATGAIEITVPDSAVNRVAITSRTFNSSPAGEFGQDIPAINASDAVPAGNTIVLQAPASAAGSRFNFGIYALSDSVVQWELLRADGTQAAATDPQTYAAGTQIQYNGGIATLLGATEQDSDVVQAVVTGGSVITYGSAVNNASNDPSYVPGIATRGETQLDFAGVDVNEDGTVDVPDANGDGVLDQPIDLFTTTGFPNYFRVVVTGPSGEAATIDFADPVHDALIIDGQTVQVAPSSALKGTSGVIRIRATAGGMSDVLTIPVNYR